MRGRRRSAGVMQSRGSVEALSTALCTGSKLLDTVKELNNSVRSKLLLWPWYTGDIMPAHLAVALAVGLWPPLPLRDQEQDIPYVLRKAAFSIMSVVSGRQNREERMVLGGGGGGGRRVEEWRGLVNVSNV